MRQLDHRRPGLRADVLREPRPIRRKLPERRPAVALEVVRLHGELRRLLGQRVARQPALRPGDGVAPARVGDRLARRDSQHVFVAAQQLPALQVGPLLESPRVPQRQAGEEARHVEARGALGVVVRRGEKRRDVALHGAAQLDRVVPDA